MRSMNDLPRPMRVAAGIFLVAALCIAPAAACDTMTEPDAGTLVPATVRDVLTGVDGATYRVVEAPPPVDGRTRVTEVLDRRGGILRLGDHYLLVPPGAVKTTTRFTMELTEGGLLRFDLHATPERSRPARNDRQRRFDVPVFLLVSYAAATNVETPEKLAILYEPHDGGAAEPVQTHVAEGQRLVIGRLEHFSRYCLASN